LANEGFWIVPVPATAKKGVKLFFTPNNQPLGIELVKQVGSDSLPIVINPKNLLLMLDNIFLLFLIPNSG